MSTFGTVVAVIFWIAFVGIIMYIAVDPRLYILRWFQWRRDRPHKYDYMTWDEFYHRLAVWESNRPERR